MDTLIVDYLKSRNPIDSVNDSFYTLDYINNCSNAVSDTDQIFGNCRVVIKSKVPCTTNDIVSSVSYCSKSRLDSSYSVQFKINDSSCEQNESVMKLTSASSTGPCFSLNASDESRSATYAFAVISGILTFGWVCMIFWSWKKNSFMRSLPWALSVFLLGSGLIVLSSLVLVISSASSCSAFAWLWSMGFPLVQGVLLAKAFRIYQIAKGKIVLTSESKLAGGVGGFLAIHCICMLLSTLVDPSLASTVVEISNNISVTVYACDLGELFVIIINMIQVFSIIFGLFLSEKIKNHRFNGFEGFFLSLALKSSTLMFTMFVLVCVFASNVDTPIVSNFAVLLALLPGIQGVIVFFPKVLELVRPEKKEKPNQSMLKILEHGIARHYFKGYMKTRLSEESVIFWEQVQEFNSLRKSQGSEQELAQKMQRILDDHLTKGAKFEINVSFELQNRVCNNIKEAIAKGSCREFQGFDLVLSEVITVMEQNDLKRFQRSDFGLAAESLVEFTSFFDALDGETRKSVMDYFELRDSQLSAGLRRHKSSGADRSSAGDEKESIANPRDSVIAMESGNMTLQEVTTVAPIPQHRDSL
eukprot:TRINITY_DN28926_c0_g2_i3.p1 TRINITY_DN28926_c0_g2~~TRINITY_DN28926_c0_g2_i3.p1  ORF type:complete len:586 (+),score=126.33 TRINITY_DN28926_c0_g2_i3:38-1795(+)